MGLGNLLTQLYNQLNPYDPFNQGSGGSPTSDPSSSSLSGNILYTCQGYVEDLRNLGAHEDAVARLNKILADKSYSPESEQGLKHSLALSNDYIKEIKNCLSDPSNLISGGGTGEPNVGMYIALGIGIAAGIGGLAWYLKSRAKKSEKTSR